MIKQIVLVDGKRGSNADWQRERAARVLRLPGVERYLYNRTIEEVTRDHRSLDLPTFGGFEEIWFTDIARVRASFIVLRDGDSSGESADLQVLTVKEHLIFSRPGATGLLKKRMTLLVRRPGMSKRDFDEYWHSIHSPLALCHRFVTRYLQNHVVYEPHRNALSAGMPQVDGIAEFLISDLERMQEDYASPAGMLMKEDVANFAERVATYLVEPCEPR